MTSYVKEDALEVVLDEIVKIRNLEGVIEEKEPIPPHLNPESNFIFLEIDSNRISLKPCTNSSIARKLEARKLLSTFVGSLMRISFTKLLFRHTI